ncbi:MAG: ABC transporter ATP-binding protein [Nocardioidaceae bacterium]
MGPPTERSAVTISGLVKVYGDRRAVDGLDLEVRRGEIFALLGPNGAGKTTTIEILEGYRRRDDGIVSVLGTDPAVGGRAWRSRIGIVLQGTNDAAELTVSELVRHFACFYPAPRAPDEVIAAVGLREHRTSRVRTLSGGQRRRLDVALGIVGDPELLFLDEPTTGFDPQARRSFWELVRSLRESGTTILLTTHYLDEAEHLADRVGVINHGCLVAVDTVDRLGAEQRRTATVSWRDEHGPQRQATLDPAAVVVALSERFRGQVPDLEVRRPDLEDVYLSMIEERAR